MSHGRQQTRKSAWEAQQGNLWDVMVQKGSVKTPIFSKLKALIIKYERDRDRQIRMIDNSGDIH